MLDIIVTKLQKNIQFILTKIWYHVGIIQAMVTPSNVELVFSIEAYGGKLIDTIKVNTRLPMLVMYLWQSLHLVSPLSDLGLQCHGYGYVAIVGLLFLLLSSSLSCSEGKCALPMNWGFEENGSHVLSRPKTHSKGMTVISHFNPEGL
ncbi:unnamed protein product, partial [Vitis vinifera]|uniref:Uncharacterized protein n=1 Tax=Vitis vinifera TaxID=29760 RepID=D7TA69_VITVI